jgi:excisionase family DNA binding protein
MSTNVPYAGQYIRAKELLNLLPIGRNTLYRLVEENKIPYKRVGRIILFSRKRINEWIEEQHTGGSDERTYCQ